MITIDQIMAVIDDNYEPTRAELLLLIDIVRDCKLTGYPIQIKCSEVRAKHIEIDDISIMELFDYKIKINHESFIKLTDKKRLFINNNKFKIYKQKFSG
jgi:hypothetical protein